MSPTSRSTRRRSPAKIRSAVGSGPAAEVQSAEPTRDILVISRELLLDTVRTAFAQAHPPHVLPAVASADGAAHIAPRLADGEAVAPADQLNVFQTAVRLQDSVVELNRLTDDLASHVEGLTGVAIPNGITSSERFKGQGALGEIHRQIDHHFGVIERLRVLVSVLQGAVPR